MTLRIARWTCLAALAVAARASPAEPRAAAGPAAVPATLAPAPPVAPRPPVAARRDHLTTWHGEQVNDPWFWLRDKANPDVRSYLEAENAYTAAMTRRLASFEGALYAELLGRIKQTDLTVPVRRGAWLYYARTQEGLQYPIHCRKRAGPGGAWDEKADEQVLLDHNALAKGLPFLAVGELVVSDDGKRLLYSTDETGFRQYRLYVKELETGEVKGPL